MRPTLPRKPSQDVDRLTVLWLGQLIDCLAYAMDYPKGDGKTTYRNGEIIRAIQQSRGAPAGAAGDEYKGYFKVIQTAPNKIKIVNGNDIKSANCFSGYINKLKVNIPVKELTISENCIIYLESITVGDPATSYTNTFKIAAALTDWVADTENSIISTVKFTAPVAPATTGTIGSFNRHDVPNHIIVWGAC